MSVPTPKPPYCAFASNENAPDDCRQSRPTIGSHSDGSTVPEIVRPALGSVSTMSRLVLTRRTPAPANRPPASRTPPRTLKKYASLSTLTRGASRSADSAAHVPDPSANQLFASTSTAPIYAALNATPVDSSTAPDSSPPPLPPPPPGRLGRSIDAPKIGALTSTG